MQLKYHDPPYYRAILDKLESMELGEIPLNHKSEEEKIKFENHLKHFIRHDMFYDKDYYVLFNSSYTGIIKFRRY